jgi:pimeloyl-ACP methyl ester carboxylesterase
MTRRLAVALLLLDVCAPALAGAAFPGTLDEWNGYRRYSFTCDTRACYVVEPRQEAAGRPWIWRARFWGHRPEVDVALLGRGYHLVYMDIVELYGSRAAVDHWNAFYRFLTGEHGFHGRAVLEGMSRGGLTVYAWAAANPDRVACIYADSPVCDFKTWPHGDSRTKGSPANWQGLLKVYGFRDDEEALAYRGNPVDTLAPLAAAGVPLLHVSGDADDVVPLEENTAVVERRYRDLGGRITVILKPGVGHVHGLADPAPIVDFVLRNGPR